MCRARQTAEGGGAQEPADDSGAKVGVAAEDPLATDLRHFHPSSSSFSALPRGEFAVVKRIAPGIHGDVFRCRWARGGEDVAVKKLRRESVASWGDAEHDERKAHLGVGGRAEPCPEDALTEIGVLQYLAEQADVPRYMLRMVGVFQDHSHVWLVTEFADGGELLDEVTQQGPLPQAKARRYMWELMQAVGYLHRHRVGHRDVSLENVLVKEGSLRLMDFGMAVSSHASCGTPLRYFRAVGKDLYRAPECYVPRADDVEAVVPTDGRPGAVVTVRVGGSYVCDVLLPADAKANCRTRAKVYGYEAPPTDVFAAGVCLFVMLSGNAPWRQAALSDGCFAWVLEHDLVALMTAWGLPVVAPDVAALVRATTCADPAQRWSAAACLGSQWLAGAIAQGH